MALFILPCSAFSQSVCDHISLDSVAQHLAMPETAEIIQKNEKGSLCEVVLRTKDALAPVYVGKDFVFVGQLFQNREPVTRKTIESLQRMAQEGQKEAARQKAVQNRYRTRFLQQHMNSLEELVSFTLSPQESVKDQVYFITDPGCGHCQNALEALHELVLNSGLLVKVIIYPILGDKSDRMALEAICQHYSYERYIKMEKVSRTSFVSCKKGEELIAGTKKLLKKADIDAVPFIIGNHASWLVEGDNIPQVMEHLGFSWKMGDPPANPFPHVLQ